MWRTDSTMSPAAAARPGPSLYTGWQADRPPTYAEAMGEMPPALPLRSASRAILEQVANTGPLWTRASARALSVSPPTRGSLPKVVVRELEGHLQQRLRTQRKLDSARGSLEQVEAIHHSVDTLQMTAVRGGLFDDDELGTYALFAAQRAVHHYEAKRDVLLSAHDQRMAELRRRTG
jgi:hypothetical protein